MNVFQRSISQISKGAIKAFQAFPASVAFALAFSIVTMNSDSNELASAGSLQFSF